MDFWCLCDFAQLSSLGDSTPHETLQARRQKGECSLSQEAILHFCVGTSPSEAHESCRLPSRRAHRHHLTTLLLPSLTGGHCLCCWQPGDNPCTEATGQAGAQAPSYSATPSCHNTAGDFFIYNQINQKVIRLELAFTNTIDCVDLVI